MHALMGTGQTPHAHGGPDGTLRCRACYGVLRFVMESGAKGCEVIVSGKLRAARAKSMKFKDGYMVSSGQPAKVFIDAAVRHVLLRQGVLGIKVGPPAVRRPVVHAVPHVLWPALRHGMACMSQTVLLHTSAKSRCCAC
jgi:hypothetical protein